MQNSLLSLNFKNKISSIQRKPSFKGTEPISADSDYALDEPAKGKNKIGLNEAESLKGRSLLKNLKHHIHNGSKKILEFINETQLVPEVAMAFMKQVMDDNETGQTFIAEILKKPKEESRTINTLVKNLGGEKKYLEWFTQSYFKAYQAYVEKFFKEATSPDELLKFAPNWKFTSFAEKQKMLSKDSDYMTFGKVPDSFGSEETYKKLISNISYEPKTGEITISDKGFEKSFKVEVFNKEQVKSCSSKFIAKVEVDGSAFIVKADPNNNDLNSMLRSDSIYVDACIDRYLTLNSANSPTCYYYDRKTNSSIYEYIPGEVMSSENFICHPNYINLMYLNNATKGINDLGIYCNENKRFNFIQTNDRGIIPIDSGNFTYFQGLKPGTYMNVELPNECGRSLPLIYASLTKARLDKESKQS